MRNRNLTQSKSKVTKRKKKKDITDRFFDYAGYADEIVSFPKRHFNKLVYLDPNKTKRLYIVDPATLTREQQRNAITLEELKIMLTTEDWNSQLYINRAGNNDVDMQTESDEVDDKEEFALSTEEDVTQATVIDYRDSNECDDDIAQKITLQIVPENEPIQVAVFDDNEVPEQNDNTNISNTITTTTITTTTTTTTIPSQKRSN